MRHWSHRFLLAYLVIYNFGFPLGYVRGTEAAAQLIRSAEQIVVTPVGKALLGVAPKVVETGSGDTANDYVRLLVELTLAFAIATGWQLYARGAAVSGRTRDVVSVLVRYALGATMLGYGFFKVIPVQMPAPGPDRLLNPLADTSPMGLLWTLMGASSAYQMFAGACEVIGGALLFWRRTTLAGALVLAGVLTNVVAMNFCFDVPVKLYSAHLLGMALFLVAPHASRLAGVLWFNRPVAPTDLRPYPYPRPWVGWLARAAKVVLVAGCVASSVTQAYESARAYGFLAPRTALHGIYRVTSFTRAGASGGAVADASRWVRVGINGAASLVSVQRADGSTRRLRIEIDERRGILTLPDPSVAGVRTALAYRIAAGGLVQIDGTFESAPIVVELVRQTDAETLLTGTGFRWVNEFPFNR